MSVRTRVDAPRRAVRTTERYDTGTTQRRAASRSSHETDNTKTGAAKRAYARRRNRLEGGVSLPPLPGRAAMSGRIPFVAAIIALLGCGLMCTLLLTTRSAEDSYHLGGARKINQQLTDEQAELQRQVAAADSAPELASRARELGMIPAKDPARLVIAPDGTVTVIGKETAQSGPPAPPLNTSPAAPTAAPPNMVQAQGERLVPVTPGQNQNPAAPGTPAPAQPPAAQDVEAHGAVTAPAQTPAAPAPAAPAPAAAPQSPAPAPAASAPAPAAPVDRPAPVPNSAPALPTPSAPAPAPQAPPVAAAPVNRPAPVANPVAEAPLAQIQTPAPRPEPAAPAGGAR
ncbi:hypothetical protein KO481_21310 [Nocardia sp. NEAU-G5]|uniref:Cell division protein FtsL n=1 Tax=Nocardia albiluteola TaxID=2842303 RepID=A0ABS6B181_9NOCA|nr:hypothetical protein [Nocardia albiluteola]MBU3064057.1 hypothetical protein [Nocardia albiluteola]